MRHPVGPRYLLSISVKNEHVYKTRTKCTCLENRTIGSSKLINKNKHYLEVTLDVNFLREAYFYIKVTGLNSREKKGHGSFNERFILL